MTTNVESAQDPAARVRLGVCMNIPALLRSLGTAPDLVLSDSGFRVEQFSDPDLKVPYKQLSGLLAASARATGCDYFGLLLGQSANPHHLGTAGFLVGLAPDVHTALRAMTDYFALHDQGGAPLLLIHPKITLLGYAVRQSYVMAIEQIHDLVTAFAYKLMLDLCGPAWRPTEVLLSRRRPANTKPYRNFFNSTIIYDADMSAVAFPSELLTQPVRSADARRFKRVKHEIAETRQLEHLDLVDALRQHLRRGLLYRRWSASDMAHLHGITERTLHRRLQSEGTSYRQELDEARRNFSLQLLSGTNMSLSQISESMCYGNSSAFTRAFVRWVGMTPSDWRRQNV